jgi:DNA invertase Pin-like site-specific DNA recombinase
MNCVIYARVSTEQQAERDLSIPAQIQTMHEYAKRQGWNVVEEFVEPGVSGRTAQRPVLQAMLNRCREQPRVDAVLVHKLDRFARSVYDHATIKFYLKQHGIRLRTPLTARSNRGLSV